MGDRPMEVFFQRRCANYIYVVPEGLRELMSDITREVLREQPKELYNFIANYLDCLFITRENAKVAALFVEDVTETGGTIADIIYRSGLNVKQASKAARIIQRAFKRFLTPDREKSVVEPVDSRIIICKMMVRLKIDYNTATCAAKVIQRAWRIYQQRIIAWKKRFGTAIEWRAAARYTLHLYKPYVTFWEAEKAATLIAAAYRGYYTRKILKQIALERERYIGDEIISYLMQEYKRPPQEELSEVSSRTIEVLYHEDYAKYHQAALVIQTAFRKHLIMKRLKQKEFIGVSRRQYLRDFWNVDIRNADSTPFSTNITAGTFTSFSTD